VNAVQADWLDIARSGLTFNAPLSATRANELVARMQGSQPASILDLGCGCGELLLRTLAATPAARGTGVDTDANELARAARRAEELGVASRCQLLRADAADCRVAADVVIVSGASQAFGGYRHMLTGVRSRLNAGGLAVVGEAVWAVAPNEAAHAILGELPLAEDVLRAAATAGLSAERAELATQPEWDDFESGFRAALDRSGDSELRAVAERRRREYEQGYRGIAGYLWLVASG
jgi:cyclopropane fatty-acyl-phospholipid synthase-like methyltransferase